VNLADGVSAHGTSARAWMAWHCEKRYGSFLPAVHSLGSHCSAEDSGDVA